MVVLKVPLHWDGRLIPEGTSIALPPALESALIDSGNALPKEYIEIVPPENPPGDSLPLASENLGSADKAAAESDLASENLGSADKAAAESDEDAAPNHEPELALGRGGSR